jgi:S-sulfosulfanyl-L-cysteine sulfohydrolase
MGEIKDMSLSRREFMQVLTAASAAGFSLRSFGTSTSPDAPSDPYEIPPFGNVTLMHFTDCHAQLLPVYFREPDYNIGVADAHGKPPHLVGHHFLEHFQIAPGTPRAHAFTYLDFAEASRQYGKIGGFAHLKTLVDRIRASRPGRTLLMDGGDSWQGSATALWTQGQDMVEASKLLGVEIMTGHWEFTYGMDRVHEIINNDLASSIEFIAQNVMLTDEAAFMDAPAHDTGTGHVFKPYTMRELNGVKIAIIGQAFPYSSLANPRYMMEDWSFQIREEEMQQQVDEVRAKGAQLVVILSHNGMDVDLKMASRVTGVDVILGGHTHDGMPEPSIINNAGGKTLVINSGSNGKFLSVLDLDVRAGQLVDFKFRMLPVFSELLTPDPQMTSLIEQVRAPYKARLEEELAVTDVTLYRRGNFNGTFDQLIVDAMMSVRDAEIAFSPGFRWGTSLLPGDPITFERLMDQTAITYPKATLTEMSGTMIKDVLEDIANNLFNPDPYLQMGGDMVRVGGLKYTIDPSQSIGQRISNLELNGSPLDPGRTYKVAGWASIQPQSDELPDIWDVVADYLRDRKVIDKVEANVPTVIGMDTNPGMVAES